MPLLPKEWQENKLSINDGAALDERLGIIIDIAVEASKNHPNVRCVELQPVP
eukprot:CAMPEP_0168317152 /NCGR_PEP_ID=MMETSP0210-20121227/22963_1 /TAXON_ID=40633 /ORGANISM="Condylostoma magnum, Strain COL2" /LENGTH=51 /DNA_ID=CAMNT_0008312039 /DNA_START=31 /DNA_END=186 /DNA_ORIENTATION=+